MANSTVLGIFAHPDDELACVGTLANHSDAGDDVHLLFLTKGEGTSKLEGSTEEIKTQRVEQAKDACSIINAKVHFLNIPDKHVVVSRDIGDQVASQIKKIKPDIIITWSKPVRTGTGHPDHRHTHDLVVNAITYARFREKDGLDPHRERISLYTMQHHESNPEDLVYVDVSDQYDRIMEFIQGYKVTFGDWDVVDHKLTLLKYFGQFVRTDYAEAFQKLTWRKGRIILD